MGEYTLGDVTPQSMRMATAFGGGIGDTQQELCGALAGGIMVIGGLLGREDADQDDRAALNLATRYRTCFLQEFGYTQCAALRKQIDTSKNINSCAELVEQAAGILLRLMASAQEEK